LKTEETHYSNITPDIGVVEIKSSLDVPKKTKELFGGQGSINHRFFKKAASTNGKFIYHLIQHHVDDAMTHPTIKEMAEFGKTLGLEECNFLDLLYFFEKIKSMDDSEAATLLRNSEVVASEEGYSFSSGNHAIAPMVKGMENLNIHTARGTCPRFILVLMKEPV
jgi:hypothetical protein